MIHVEINLIDGNCVGKGEAVEPDIAVKDFIDVGIGSVEAVGDTGGSGGKVAESIHDQKICGICVSAVFVDKAEGFRGFKQTCGVRTTPPALLEDDDRAVVILKDRVIDLTFPDAPGIHAKVAERAETDGRARFESNGLHVALDGDVRDHDVGVFQVQKVCDSIHVSSFSCGFFVAEKG